MACVMVAVMAANERPYEMANVVERKSGLYSWYAVKLSVPSGVRIRVTLYSAPVLPYAVREDIGMYLAYQVLV